MLYLNKLQIKGISQFCLWRWLLYVFVLGCNLLACTAALWITFFFFKKSHWRVTKGCTMWVLPVWIKQCHRTWMLEEIEMSDLQLLHQSTKVVWFLIEYFQYFGMSSGRWLFYEENSIILRGRYFAANLIGWNWSQSVEIMKWARGIQVIFLNTDLHRRWKGIDDDQMLLWNLSSWVG